MLFGTLICADLQLICTLQIAANQDPSATKKHCKTRANQRKSLQITGPKKHGKKDADLHPRGAGLSTGMLASPLSPLPQWGSRPLHNSSTLG